MVEGFTNLTGFKSNLVYTVREVGSALTLTVRGYIFNIVLSERNILFHGHSGQLS